METTNVLDKGFAAAIGCPASSGVGRGRARWIGSAREALAAPAGEVLLAWALPAGWVPLLAGPAAIAVVDGGALASAATLLRERGIPAVFGVGGALRALWDGQLIEVDGAAGLVRAIAEERPWH